MNSGEVWALAITVTGVLGVVGTIAWAWVRSQEYRRSQGPDGAELANWVRAEVEALRAEHAGQIAELQERVDFTERMLARGQQRADKLDRAADEPRA